VDITGNSVIVLGNSGGSLGTLNLRDANSSLNAPVIQIGNAGSGIVNLDLSAEANATTVNVGAGEFGEGALNIDGSATLNATNLRVGSASNGEMLVENGLVTCTTAIIGNSATAVGTATLQSTSALLMCDSLTVGNSGSGDLFFVDGGAVFTDSTHVNDSSQIVFQQAGSGFAGTLASTSGVTVEGTLVFLSGQGEVAGSVVTSGNGQVQVGATASGTIFGNLTNNGLRVLVSPTANLDVQGDWTGDSPFIGIGNVVLNGAARPGNGIGSVEFQGNVLLGSPSVVEIEIAGVNPGSQYDQMLVDGDVDLFGSLDVTMQNGFQPLNGQVFTIMEIGGTQTGLFAGLNEGDVVTTVNNVELAITYQGGDGNDIALQATEIAFVAGDINLDGVVDLLDVSPFVELLTSGQYQLEADINMDGNVNLLDVSLFVGLLTGN
jgi:T5SS/PEP-CTERM-associated repeat protein